jgi:uncharacterized Rmd1/YagE family protein
LRRERKYAKRGRRKKCTKPRRKRKRKIRRKHGRKGNTKFNKCISYVRSETFTANKCIKVFSGVKKISVPIIRVDAADCHRRYQYISHPVYSCIA